MNQVALNSSDLIFVDWRPVVVSALAMFDPVLRLVRSRRLDMYQLYKRGTTNTRYEIDGYGTVVWREPIWLWQADLDVITGLDRDDPHPLIRNLWENDTQRDPEQFQRSMEYMRAYRDRARRKISENYRHAFLDNKRLLMKAWEPFVNQPGFVR